VRYASWIALLVPFFWLVARLWPYDAYSGDYAQYLLHAKALLEGRSYTDIGYIYSPLSAPGPAAYPPGLPGALFLLFSVFGWHEQVGRLLVLACALVFFAAIARYFTQHDDHRLALACAVVVSISAQIPENAIQILSDMPFCALCWVAFVIADRESRWSWARTAGLIAVGTAAILTRSAGVVLVPAMLLYWILNVRTQRFRPLIVAAVWGVAFWYTARDFPTVGSYVTFFSDADTARVAAISGGNATGASATPSIVAQLWSLAMTSASRVLEYRFIVLEGFFYPFPWKLANQAYHIVVLAVMAIGLGSWLRRSYRSFLASFALGYLGLLAVYPFPVIRYLWPLVPLVVFGALRGAQLVIERMVTVLDASPRVRVASERAVPLIALAWTVGLFVRALDAPRLPAAREYAEVRDLYDHARRGHQLGQQRWLVFNPRVLTLYTGMPAMALLREDPALALNEITRLRITHVVVGSPLPADPISETQAIIDARPSQFALEYRNAMFSVFRFSPDRQ
jgi:hypothetical protein